MRAQLTAALVALCGLASAPSAAAQGVVRWSRTPASRPPLVPFRPELPQPVGPTKLEALHIESGLGSPERRPEATPATPDRARPARLCPMPVVRPDTTRLERMPIVRSDTTRAAPASMPAVSVCENPLFR